jgi:uncharacterized lipoprotein YddW (UPF0748 family)
MRTLITLLLILTTSVPALSGDHPKREMRAVWIATVENIDWPSKPGLPARVQRREMIELLDLAQAYNLNTVIVQIRPAADAFYPSALEPWSHWLTGEQGRAPKPEYDPLTFIINECRERGLDIHVWLNPYRVLRDTAFSKTAALHATNAHADWLVTYGSLKYFDPALPQVRDHVARVVSDIVRRYDVDAIHMDDYFYPYRLAGADFPDEQSFALYGGNYTPVQRDDWRRNNVDLIIRQLHDSIKAIKPHVQFGISPFGVWRNAAADSTGSATRAGQTNYDDLYADILKWQKNSWIDYVVPQLYWHIGFEIADYAVLAEWWNNNSFGCPVYIGHALYRLNAESSAPEWRTPDQITKQISLNRNYPHIYGSVLYSAKYLRTNPLGIKQKLLGELYKYPSLCPVNPLIEPINAGLPEEVKLRRGIFCYKLSWKNGPHTRLFVVYRFEKGQQDFSDPALIFKVTPKNRIRIRKGKETRLKDHVYAVSALSITHDETTGIIAAD